MMASHGRRSAPPRRRCGRGRPHAAVIICARSHMRRCRKRPQSNCLSSSCASANAPRWGSYAGFAGGLSCRCRWQLGRSVAALRRAQGHRLGRNAWESTSWLRFHMPCGWTLVITLCAGGAVRLGVLWRVVPPSPCAGSRRSPRQTHDCVGVVQVSAPLSRCPWLNLAPAHRRWRGVG